MKNKMTLAPEIAKAISKAFSELHASFQAFKQRFVALETALKNLEKDDDATEIALKKSTSSLQHSANVLENFRKFSHETLIRHEQRIEHLEQEVRNLKANME